MLGFPGFVRWLAPRVAALFHYPKFLGRDGSIFTWKLEV
jgi:hypothetical protein